MPHAKQQVLIVIDIQNDYFPGGQFAQWQAEETLTRIEALIARAHREDIPVVLVQHVGSQTSPFFRPETPGVDLHPRLIDAAPQAPIVVKKHADAFLETALTETLAALKAEQLLICGMMTQNCVTHTAISRAAENFQVKLVADACTSVSQIIHRIALNALGDRVEVVDSETI